MKRRFVGIAAGGVAGMLALAGCGGGGGGNGGSGNGGNTITFVAAEYSTKTQPYWQSLIKSFEKKNPKYKVNLQVINWNDIDQKVKTLVQTGQQPDILNLNHFADFAADNLLYPAQDVISPSVRSDMLSNFVNNSKYKGTQYGLPFIASSRLFMYNKAIFAKAHISSPPTTWAQVFADAKKIHALGGGLVGYGLPLGPEEAQAESSLWFYSNGGNWTSGPGKWTINSPQNVETFKFLKKMVDAGVTQPNPATTNRTDLYDVFAQGKVGMLNGAVFLPGMIAQQNAKMKFGIAPIPGKNGPSAHTLGVEDYLMAFKNSGNKPAVKAFLDYFYSPDNYVTFLKREGFLPVTKSGSARLKTDPTLKPFVNSLPSANFYPSTEAAWPKVQGWVQQNIGKAVTSDPKQVLDQAQQIAQSS